MFSEGVSIIRTENADACKKLRISRHRRSGSVLVTLQDYRAAPKFNFWSTPL